jgi:hypothetical protein
VARGGARKGAGRKLGVSNKKTTEQKARMVKKLKTVEKDP